MQKLLLTIVLSALGLTSAYAQATAQYELFGSYVDLDGKIIHEYADHDYTPRKSLNVSYNSISVYAPGIYYTPDGRAERGLILYSSTGGSKDFLFKKNEAEKKQKIDVSLGWSFKVGADSFTVANNFTLYSKLGIIERNVKNGFVLSFMAQTNHFAFFKYTSASGNSNFVVRKIGTNEYTSLPLVQKAFVEEATKLFAAYPALIALLHEKSIAPDQIDELVRFIRYSDALEANKPIAYTANWDIANNIKTSIYFATVSKPEKNWKLDFYNKAGQKLFSEHYDYAQPTKNDGQAEWYYPNSGIVRKKGNFEMGEPDEELTVYHPNGKLHYRYHSSLDGKISYTQVFSKEEKPLLDHTGTGVEEFLEESTQRTITREFKNFALAASYYTDHQNRKIYQYAGRNAKIRNFKSFNNNIAESVQYSHQAVMAGEEGIVLLKMLVTPYNRLESCSILRGISQAIDNQALIMFSDMMFGQALKSGKHAREEVYQE